MKVYPALLSGTPDKVLEFKISDRTSIRSDCKIAQLQGPMGTFSELFYTSSSEKWDNGNSDLRVTVDAWSK